MLRAEECVENGWGKMVKIKGRSKKNDVPVSGLYEGVCFYCVRKATFERMFKTFTIIILLLLSPEGGITNWIVSVLYISNIKSTIKVPRPRGRRCAFGDVGSVRA